MISMPTFVNLRHAPALLCAVAFAVAGCSASAATDIPTPRTASDLTLPLDAYELGPTDRAQVLRARFALVKECMRRFGLDFQAPSTEPIFYPKNGNYLKPLSPATRRASPGRTGDTRRPSGPGATA